VVYKTYSVHKLNTGYHHLSLSYLVSVNVAIVYRSINFDIMHYLYDFV